ncbi:transglycosylase domain-containing protein [Glacieibacterium frigidum]|uniref:transglycosylase domain-containing protein n=1 Tax=Glacieibacterium frigidum TaxID=2593303 RepID=UPI001F217704|nr:transglycosylase domain-containing protein [Glacieibacterium frigidum]
MLKLGAAIVVLVALAIGVYGGIGYLDALDDAPALKKRAAGLIAARRGPADLTPRKLDQLIRVEDPSFWQHNGIDVTSSGAGITTLTQSLAKRTAFTRFRPRIGKIRQTTYALGLERRLTKVEILALGLDTAQMGRGPKGWMQGVFTASEQVFGKRPADLSDRQWLRLVAVLIAPGTFRLSAPDARLDERVARIEKLLDGRCRPRSNGDVWLDGCV